MVQEWSWYRDEDDSVLGMVWDGDSSGLGKVQERGLVMVRRKG